MIDSQVSAVSAQVWTELVGYVTEPVYQVMKDEMYFQLILVPINQQVRRQLAQTLGEQHV